MKTYWYRGCFIQPASSVYWRWESWIDGVGAVYAETLAGMRDLIRHYLKLTQQEKNHD